MVESRTWSCKACGRQWLDALLGWWRWLTFVLQSQYQDAFDAPHLQQIEAEGACAGGIQSFRRIAVGQAQQLLALAQLRPGEGTFQQPLGKVANVRSQLHCLTHHAVRGTHGVSGPLPAGSRRSRWTARLWACVGGP